MYNDDFVYYNSSLPYNGSNMMLNDNQISNQPNKYLNYKNTNAPALYSPYEGLLRGNMFKNLYSPYFKEEPFPLNPRNNQEKDLYNLMALGFATTDLNLYLDVHPDNREMISLYNKYENEYNRLLSDYESKYGPIDLSSKTLNSYPWSWNESLWPWEGNK